ncbi:recombinase RecJ [Thermoplasmatales archaeon SW_10_69_26]|nr:MAG: recombinase RecJ [Thermoplasmatales archaeon SW_10_69_26]
MRDAHAIKDASREAADRLAEADEVHLVGHIDADGLCAAGIASRAMTEAGIPHEVTFVKTMGKPEAGDLLDENPATAWMVDLGSGVADNFIDREWIIADHHEPPKGPEEGPNHHVNPHYWGLDGSVEVSGAGLTWGIARHLVDDETAGELAAMAIVGAVGDLQNAKANRLVGLNRSIVQYASDALTVDPIRDVTLYGRETRELHKFFQYADDPEIPGVSGSATAAIQFLAEHEVPRRDPDGEDRAWVHLDHDEKSRLISAAVRRVIANGEGSDAVRRLFGEVYQLPQEPVGTQLHDAKEFATLLNSTARYDRADVGMALVKGDRDEALAEAHELMDGHRRALVQGVDHVLDQGLERVGQLEYFHGEDHIRDTIVGIVAGMVSGRRQSDDDAVTVGFAHRSENEVKVSTRAPKGLVSRGVKLSEAVADAAQSTGGEGGGHDGAAGATIPKGTESDFLAALNRALDHQLKARV